MDFSICSGLTQPVTFPYDDLLKDYEVNAFADLNVFIEDKTTKETLLPPKPLFDPNMFDPVNKGGYSTLVLSANVINNIMWGVYSTGLLEVEINQEMIDKNPKIPEHTKEMLSLNTSNLKLLFPHLANFYP